MRVKQTTLIFFHLEARQENKKPKMKPPEAIQSEKIGPFCSLSPEAKNLKRKEAK
jgi:hypothetical protein